MSKEKLGVYNFECAWYMYFVAKNKSMSYISSSFLKNKTFLKNKITDMYFMIQHHHHSYFIENYIKFRICFLSYGDKRILNFFPDSFPERISKDLLLKTKQLGKKPCLSASCYTTHSFVLQ